MKFEEAGSAVDNGVFEDHVGPVQVKEVHEFGGAAGAETCIIDLFGFVVEFDWHGTDFDALEIGLLDGHRRDFFRVIVEVEEACYEVQSILVDVKAERKNCDLSLVSAGLLIRCTYLP